MKLVKSLTIGIVIGGGLILPGVSGAVLAVLFGVYDEIIKAISNIFKNFKKNFFFLLPILIGVLIGVLFIGNILKVLFDSYPVEARCVFLGLVLGGVPVLFKQIKIKSKKSINIFALSTALIISFLLFVWGGEAVSINLSNNLGTGFTRYMVLFLTGIIYVSGKVIPGISSSFMLMLIGMYEYVLDVISSVFTMNIIDYFELLPFFLGIVLGGFAFVKIIEYLFKHCYVATYSAIVGFVIGSLPILYPGLGFNLQGLISIILIAVAYIVSYTFSINRN